MHEVFRSTVIGRKGIVVPPYSRLTVLLCLMMRSVMKQRGDSRPFLDIFYGFDTFYAANAAAL